MHTIASEFPPLASTPGHLQPSYLLRLRNLSASYGVVARTLPVHMLTDSVKGQESKSLISSGVGC